MEKVSLYVKKILALVLSLAVFVFLIQALNIEKAIFQVLIASGAFLLYAVIDFRITGEKPRFLFGMNQSDAYLNKKGGFWNLFKWVVNLFGFLYDLVVWSIWGVYLLFVLFVDILLLIKTIIFWIIHAFIWFLRQLFPPFIFMFKMFMHYLISWVWWIYQLAFRNMKISVNKNFFFIALWGIIPALFIIFLFYATSQMVGIEGLVALSAVFALIPLVWSYGEIAALRFENREKDDYAAVQASFGKGFEAVKAVLFYLVIILILIIAEIILNLLGWIPNLSLSLLGITLNLNMAMSFVLVFLAIIISFAGQILPTHILYKPEHENDLDSSLNLLQTIGKKFLRYSFAEIPASLFGGLLLVIPIVVMLVTFSITDTVKDKVLDVRVEKLESKTSGMEALDAYRADVKIQRLNKYKEIPLLAGEYFQDLRASSGRVKMLKNEKSTAEENLDTRKVTFQQDLSSLAAQITVAKAGTGDAALDEVNRLSASRLDIEEEYLSWEANQKECIAVMDVDIKEQKGVNIQMPILYFFVGILFAFFGGLVLAIYVSYMGNVYFELYNLKEDDKPTYWCQTIAELKAKDPNQPLLGFTFLAILGVLAYLCISGVISF